MNPPNRFTIVPAVYLVFIRDGKILLSQRANTGYLDGMYMMIAGHLDGGETFTQAVIREAKEEAGIRVASEHVRFLHAMHRKATDHERMDMFFAVSEWKGEIVNNEPYKCAGLEWFNLADLPPQMSPYVQKAIEYIQGGVAYSEEDWG